MTKTIRSVDQRVAELEQKIQAIRSRDERKRAKAKPEVRLALAATKALDKAVIATNDVTLRKAFQEARTTVAAAVAIEGITLPPSTVTSGKPRGRKPRATATA